jgi:hypothetical protein
MTLTQQMGLSAQAAQMPDADESVVAIGHQWWGPLIKKVGDSFSQMTPLERMNRRHPNLWLRSLPETGPRRDWIGEPDPVVCLQYYRRFMAASESRGDEPIDVLLEFLVRASNRIPVLWVGLVCV